MPAGSSPSRSRRSRGGARSGREVSIPRSPTRTTSVRPKRIRSLSTWASTVAGSAVLPGKASTATGQPRRIGEQAELDLGPVGPVVAGVAVAGERAVAALDVHRREVVQDEAARAEVAGRERALDPCLAGEEPVHRPVQLVLVGALHPARRAPGCSARAAPPWRAWTRARPGGRRPAPSRGPGCATAGGRGAPAGPSERSIPRTAATWPWGRLRTIRSADSAGTRRSPRSERSMASTTGSGRAVSDASVRCLTDDPSRYDWRSRPPDRPTPQLRGAPTGRCPSAG